MVISNMTILSSNSNPETLKLGNFGTKFMHFLFLHKIPQFHKFEDVDFKSNNSFFKTLTQKDTIKTFLFAYSDIFLFSQNFAIIQIRQCWLECNNIVFNFQQQNSEVRYFWSQIYAFSFPSQNFGVWQVWRCWF